MYDNPLETRAAGIHSQARAPGPKHCSGTAHHFQQLQALAVKSDSDGCGL